jgi:hypothetical protein
LKTNRCVCHFIRGFIVSFRMLERVFNPASAFLRGIELYE